MTNEQIVSEIQSGICVSDNMQELYEQNRGIIYEIAKKYSAYDDLEDLMQESYFALHSAVQSYTSDRDACFITYFRLCLENHLISYLGKTSSLIRIPSYKRTLINRYNRALEEYRKKYGCFPSNNDIATLLEISKCKAENLRRDARIQHIDSLDRSITSDADEMCLIESVSDEHDCFEELEERIFQEQLSIVLWELVETLKPIERDIIKLRFKDDLTLDEIATRYGKSKERIRQIQERALRTLSRGPSSRKLKSFLTYDRAYSLGLQCTGLGAFRKTHTSSVERAVLKALDKEAKKN